MEVEDGEDDLSEDNTQESAENNLEQQEEDLEDGQLESSEDDTSEKEVFLNLSKGNDSNAEQGQRGQTIQSVVMETDRKEQLRKIDREMKQRLIELQKLMESGGLTESAELLAQMSKGQQKDKPNQQGQVANEGMEQHAFINLNANANVNIGQAFTSQNKEIDGINSSKSMETIYEAAVPQRDSSSSEEELLINTSDESVNQGHEFYDKQNNSMDKQIEVLIADGRCLAGKGGVGQGKMQEQQPQPST